MSTFEVDVTTTIVRTITVEADCVLDAEDLAIDIVGNPSPLPMGWKWDQEFDAHAFDAQVPA